MQRKRVNANFKRRRRVFFREWRKHRGLTQEQLAARVERSTSWVSQIENGEIGYTEETLELLAGALQCDPADFLVRNPSEASAIWSIWEGLQPSQRIQAAAILEALKKAS